MSYLIKYVVSTGRVLEALSSNMELPQEESVDIGYIESNILPGLGAYIENGQLINPPPKPSDHHVFDDQTRAWMDMRAFPSLLVEAHLKIDEWAGNARLRYITSVPGQAETYAKKEKQARDWAAANFTGPAPSFIAAEALALSVPPDVVAAEVISLADYWEQTKGPQIEAVRRKWKVQASGTVNGEQLTQLLADAKLELDSL